MPTKANFPSMRRLVIPIAALIAVLAIPAGANAYTLGVSDQQASTFTNPLFAPLKFKAARYITPYDVMESPADKAQWDAWYTAATAANQKVLVSFEHSHRSNSRALKAPTVAAYTKELKKFKAAYPKRQGHLALERGQPLPPHDRRERAGPADQALQPDHRSQGTAQYYMAARKVFKGSKYRSSALDILDEQNVNKTIKYLQSFLRHASPDPKIIGFHNYSDTNRFSTTRTKRVLAAFHGKVWLTETGGIVKLGSSFPSTRAARRRRWAACSRSRSRTPASSGCSSTSSTRRPIRRRRSSTPA